MTSDTDKFGENYFENRAEGTLFKGRDLSFVKYPFWDRVIKKHGTEDRLLDVGCAEGALLRWAERHGYETYGIYVSNFALRIARQRLNWSRLLVGDVRWLPFKDNYFNVITCFDVLEHLESPQIALSELNRVLRDDGTFLISVPNISSNGLKWKGAGLVWLP